MLRYVCGVGKVSKTRSLSIVLQKLEKHKMAVSVVSLAEELHDEMNRTTVYRILKRLEDNGTLHSFIGKDGVRWYAKTEGAQTTQNYHAHPHIQCEKCGRTECLPVEVEIPHLPDHKIESVSLLYVGDCGQCGDQ